MTVSDSNSIEVYPDPHLKRVKTSTHKKTQCSTWTMGTHLHSSKTAWILPPKKTQNPVVDGLAKSVSSNLGTRWKPERCTKKPWPLPRRNFAISQRGKGIIIFKFALVGGMLVPWRIFVMIPSGKLTYIAMEYPHFQWEIHLQLQRVNFPLLC